MEISILIAIFVTVTGAMYKLKQDYEDFYDKKLSLVFLMIFIFTILCTFSYTSGVDYVLVTIEDITLLKDFQSMLKTTNSIIVLSSSCLISWFIILFLPAKRNKS
ncbi:hypothetical protein O1D11_003563 [Vibrio cholerae]|nr:hypothetical protein [Vibrio cholerae]EGR5566894.1 hypothetical protein [Vibrio cholerae]EGR5575273.1 hypothetical protein [Vibrio cholerae]EJL6510676.1 hypothetical protein [Vibrio cholerae]EKF9792831.1 hypothetical protein [Vibrio cholerae]MBJ6954362.1 hypothetical protein [Vibrio cholerae]